MPGPGVESNLMWGKHKPSAEALHSVGTSGKLRLLSLSLWQKHSCWQKSLRNLEQTNFFPLPKVNKI